MKTLISLATFLLILVSNSFATNFYFSGNEDADYTNPANWYPTYPGATIGANDKVFIQADANIVGFDLMVEGLLDISMGAKISAVNNNLVLKNNAKVMNNGEIVVSNIKNEGIFENCAGARVACKQFNNTISGTMNSGIASKSYINELFLNEGIYNLSSECVVKGDFVNKKSVTLSHQATLNVKGELNSTVLSKMQQGERAKVNATKTTTEQTKPSSYMNLMKSRS